jgi:hypothetical protein
VTLQDSTPNAISNVLPEDPHYYLANPELPKDRKGIDGTPVYTSTNSHNIVSPEKSTRKAPALVPPKSPLWRDNNVEEKSTVNAPSQPHHQPSH